MTITNEIDKPEMALHVVHFQGHFHRSTKTNEYYRKEYHEVFDICLDYSHKRCRVKTHRSTK